MRRVPSIPALQNAAILLAALATGAARQCEWSTTAEGNDVGGQCGTLGAVQWADMLPNGYLDAYAELRAATLRKFYIAPGHNPEAFGGMLMSSEKEKGQHYVFPLICDDSDEARIRLDESISSEPVLREMIHGTVRPNGCVCAHERTRTRIYAGHRRPSELVLLVPQRHERHAPTRTQGVSTRKCMRIAHKQTRTNARTDTARAGESRADESGAGRLGLLASPTHACVRTHTKTHKRSTHARARARAQMYRPTPRS